jgi:hypothetical protein
LNFKLLRFFVTRKVTHIKFLTPTDHLKQVMRAAFYTSPAKPLLNFFILK